MYYPHGYLLNLINIFGIVTAILTIDAQNASTYRRTFQFMQYEIRYRIYFGVNNAYNWTQWCLVPSIELVLGEFL